MNPITAVPIAAFLKRNLGCMTKWTTGRHSRENFMMWLSWNLARFNVCCVTEEGRLSAVGIARTMNDPRAATDQYHAAETGKVLFVDHAVAKTNDGYKCLLRYCRARWPHVERIAFHRSKSGSILKTYDFNTFLRKAKV